MKTAPIIRKSNTLSIPIRSQSFDVRIVNKLTHIPQSSDYLKITCEVVKESSEKLLQLRIGDIEHTNIQLDREAALELANYINQELSIDQV